MRTRSWSIRAKIISLLLIPLVTLIAMWALATAVTVGPGLKLLDAQSTVDNIGRPALALVMQVQQERRLTAVFLASGRRDSGALNTQRDETDSALATFRRMSGSSRVTSAATDLTTQRLSDLSSMLDSLPRQRDSIDRGEVERGGAVRFYTDLIDAAHALYGSLIRLTDDTLARQARALLALRRASEAMAQEDTLISAAIAAGGFSSAELAQVIQLIGVHRFITADTLPDLYDGDRTVYEQLAKSDDFIRLEQFEDKITASARAGSNADPPVDPVGWHTAYTAANAKLRDFATSAESSLVERTTPTALVAFGNIALAGLVGLVTVLVTIIASVRMGRSLIKRLAGLRQAAQELAIDRLPQVMTRLRHGESVDIQHEAPDLPYGDDEIGQVGHAFNEVQRTAVRSAVEEASLRHGLNQVFLNIARRSQTLLHRQLTILDRMERRTDDPTELEDLFRVDHLATRMRRHAEDLVILAGAAPGRGWRNPVPIMDVVRGAVSEVEDYARVSIRPMPDLSLVGRAVGDVIHLLAELIENSTSFSPPHTRVNVAGDVVAHGFAIEIEDRGLGMSPEAVLDANERLANPPDFDPVHSAQLGLFVVARLAARHGVKVSLRSSPYGGITAVALVPEDLIEVGELPGVRRARDPLPALPSRASTDPGPAANGSGYREIPTAARAAITASPRSETRTAPAKPDSVRDTHEASVAEPSHAELTRAEPPRAERTHTEPPRTELPRKATRTPRKTAAGSSSQAQAVTGQAGTGQATPRLPSPRQAQVRPTARHARQEYIDAPASAGSDGLPRRIRQSSIAPQLRGGSTAASDDNATLNASSRSPEQMRAMMSSFQEGMNRGRRDADSVADDVTSAASERDAQ
jgi:nitrate/nitrite sensing protein/histidine kinase/DNA gyrase B/HSP90-like ATPase